MKKLIVVILLLVLTACSQNKPLEAIIKEYPSTVKKTAEQLPDKIQKEILVPKQLPIEVKNVYMDVQKNIENGEINLISIQFANGEGVILYVDTYYNATFSPDDQHYKTTNLKDGTKVFIVNENKNSKSIRWKKGKVYHSIMILKLPEIQKEYTIDDLIITADSMSK